MANESISKIGQLYAERNALAVAFCKAALAAGWKAGRGIDQDPCKDWEPAWRHVVYVDLPNGVQVSWHMHPDQVHLLEGFPEYDKAWDETFVARDFNWPTNIPIVSGIDTEAARQPSPPSLDECDCREYGEAGCKWPNCELGAGDRA
jgi:hypothetical protein